MSEQKKTTTEKLGVLKNRKIILGSAALAIGIVVIAFCSFVPYAIQPEKLTTSAFITDLLMTCAIVVMAMVSAIFIGQAGNAQNPKSKIAKATVRFSESKGKIINIGVHKFKQWIKKVQQPADIKDIKLRMLSESGIEDETILDLNIPEIRSLLDKAQIINKVPYPALTAEQVETAIRLKSKGIKLDLVPPEYYLNVRNLLDKRTRSERAAAEGKKKALTLVSSVVSKLVLTIAFSVIFTMLAKDLSSQMDTVEAVTKFASRMWSFATSCFMGYLVGCQINDIDAEYINMRYDTHLEFLEDTEFKALSIKEEAKEQFVERMKEEQRLLPDNTIYLDNKK